jgi:hypothetical protein
MIHLSQKAFVTIAAAHGEAWRWVGLLTFFHMVSIIGLREDLCLKNPGMRVLATLSRMTGPHWGGPPQTDDGSGPGVTIDVSQGDLAELCNVSRAFLSGILAALKEEGLVEPGYGSIRFPDPGALRDRMMVEH